MGFFLEGDEQIARGSFVMYIIYMAYYYIQQGGLPGVTTLSFGPVALTAPVKLNPNTVGELKKEIQKNREQCCSGCNGK